MLISFDGYISKQVSKCDEFYWSKNKNINNKLRTQSINHEFKNKILLFLLSILKNNQNRQPSKMQCECVWCFVLIERRGEQKNNNRIKTYNFLCINEYLCSFCFAFLASHIYLMMIMNCYAVHVLNWLRPIKNR